MFYKISALFLLFVVVSFSAVCANSQSTRDKKVQKIDGWKTNIGKRSIELDEIISGGPGKDGIPALVDPKFVSLEEAGKWLGEKEPVISLVIDGEARAYPLQILIWHEIINDEFNGVPVAVTFCPLCYSAIAFDRRLDGKTYNFGVSGMLRHSDMIMFDRETESWWQQITGEAIVGDLTGKELKQIPAQIVGFGQFAEAFPKGLVVSRETGYNRDYGRNPYVGYDEIGKAPFLFRGKLDDRLPPMEKIVVVEIGGVSKAYPRTITRKMRVINDEIKSNSIVIFHNDGANSALDAGRISDSKDIGATGVFDSEIDGKVLTFNFADGVFIDKETNSKWNIFGKAFAGKLKNKQLKPIKHGDYFAFAWLTFRPKTEIYRDK
ncbi:MAG: DUF3179 domain-containing protein [Acidobacteriota bacterium]|nr:DUF3179 domain-containing protein [Acidobacteriota bacterium]